MDLGVILDRFSKLIDPNNASFINLVNIATLSDGDEFLEQKSSITMSVVNIQEDKTMKNQPVFQRNIIDNNFNRFAHPTKYLVVSILFASYNIDPLKYLDGLGKLQTVIDFFQQNNLFFYKISAPNKNEVLTSAQYSLKTENEKDKYSKFTVLSVDLSLEQTNQMWSYLGSKYMPSVLYEMRVLPVQQDTVQVVKSIEEIKIKLWENDKKDATGLLESSQNLKFEKDENGKIIEKFE